MSKQIVIIGAGFAGVWSALSAKRLLKLRNAEDRVKVLVIAPEPLLVLRPRLYEANAAGMKHHLGDLFHSTGVKFFQGSVTTIETESHLVHAQAISVTDAPTTIKYDRLILAAGSTVKQPQSVAGLREFAFDIDALDSAMRLEDHIKGLSSLPESSARDTVVVCGAGFTGIELAAELPKRLLDHIARPRVILLESSDELGPALGPGPRPVITQALKDLGVQVRTGMAVASVDAQGVTLASGEYIKSMTTIWTAGVVATTLTQQVQGPKDSFSRLHVDQYLRTPSADHVFATGDAARALADGEGHHALMSCQHALQLGRVSGHNAAADLLGEPMVEYSQPTYGCCLDLGAYGAVIGRGWDREVAVTGERAKRVKEYVNRKLIYPPKEASEALSLADPVGSDADELPILDQVLQIVG
jgi:NADH:ubiquinone reductase (H+-translocating)